MLKIALAQMKMADDKETNYTKAVSLIRHAADDGCNLICFPEIQLTPFFPQYEKRDSKSYVSFIDDTHVQGLCAACKDNHIYAAPNLYIEESGYRYDMSFLINDEGEIIGRQKMVHVAQCENFYEQDYYTPSEEGFSVFDTKWGKIGIVVCFDRHYPESIRTEALRGAELIIIPTANTTAEPSEMFLWEVKVQAFQNSVNIAMCNRVGREGNMEFSGESVVVDYSGNKLAFAGSDEELVIVDVDLPGATKARNEKPYTALRRLELYG